jgi:flavin reductase (DIM6/NTAB) family NADH-FMN oxidoreductase RutF
MLLLWTFLCVLCLFVPSSHAFLEISTSPPLLSSPVFSLATTNRNGETNHNILTYATPVSVLPDRVWCLGLYKETLSYENFVRNRCGILQLLTGHHIPYVRLLGGQSGRTVDKIHECQRLGCTFEELPIDPDENKSVYQLLSGCPSYLRLIVMGEIVDAGSHAVAICRVETTYAKKTTTTTRGNDSSSSSSSQSSGHLNTATLRNLGIINEQGRVVVNDVDN